MGPTALLLLSKGRRAEDLFFSPWNIPKASRAGMNPRTLGSKGQHATSRPTETSDIVKERIELCLYSPICAFMSCYRVKYSTLFSTVYFCTCNNKIQTGYCHTAWQFCKGNEMCWRVEKKKNLLSMHKYVCGYVLLYTRVCLCIGEMHFCVYNVSTFSELPYLVIPVYPPSALPPPSPVFT
jgi:hypothetical protein